MLFVIGLALALVLWRIVGIFGARWGVASAFYYSVPLMGILVAWGGLVLPPRLRVNLAMAYGSILVTVYGIEIALFLTAGNPQEAAVRAAGRPYDSRTMAQVVTDLRSDGLDAYPAVYPARILETSGLTPLDPSSGTDILPLGGISDVLTVLCKEGGTYITYPSDEHGFRNPHGIWEEDALQAAVVGDSFTNGSCVSDGEDFVARLRARWPRTLNLGMGGNGPWLELAGVREFLPRRAPSVVFWAYYEGNDLTNLMHRREANLVTRYLDPGFRQGLEGRQDEVDELLVSWIDSRLQRRSGHPFRRLSSAIRRVVTLPRIRVTLGITPTQLAPGPEIVRDFLRILEEAQASVSSWDGELVVVYLPAWSRYHGGREAGPGFAEEVVAGVEEAGIAILDLRDDFSNVPDPSRLFQLGDRTHSHYSNLGYCIVAARLDGFLQQGLGSPLESPLDPVHWEGSPAEACISELNSGSVVDN